MPPPRPEWPAYHEAGHIVAAAVLKFPLQSSGIHIDAEGKGTSLFAHPSATCSQPFSDREARQKRVIVVLSAGLIAQKRFCLDSPDTSAVCDKEQIEQYLAAIYRDQAVAGTARTYFCNEAARVVDWHWPAISEVAEQLWKQPWTPRVEAWPSKLSAEKMLSGVATVEILGRNGIGAFVEDSVKEDEIPVAD
jgi:hypothetical protein